MTVCAPGSCSVLKDPKTRSTVSFQSIRATIARTPGLREADTVFSYIKRYTRFVVFSKWFLGVVSLLAITLLIAWPLLTRDSGGVRVSFVMQEGKPGESTLAPVMNKPRYEGTDDKGQKYTITADKAIQRSTILIGLENVVADMFTASGAWLSLTAKAGEFHDDTKLLYLSGGVMLYHEDGYNFTTERVEINTNTSEARGDLAVQGQGPMGNLLATGFEIKDNGSRILFGGKGRVNMILNKVEN
jgi:lipopolysaccharide export system protein LptC